MANPLSIISPRLPWSKGGFSSFFLSSIMYFWDDFRCSIPLLWMFQELEGFLLAADGANFSIPELNILKQRYSNCCSWVSRAKNILGKLYATSDYHNAVEELTGILKEAELLGVKGMLFKYFLPWILLYFKCLVVLIIFTRAIILCSWWIAYCGERTKEVLM